MKPVRLLLIFLGILIALVVAAAALALTPSVQRWAVLRAVQSQPGLQFEAVKIAASFSHLSLVGVQVEKAGLAVKLDRLDADYSLWALAFNRRLVISRITASGLVVDASRISRAKAEAAAAGAPAAAPGLLTQIELPLELVLGDCLIEGRALLPGAADGPAIAADFKLSGGQFAPGQEGTLQLLATLKNPGASGQGAKLHAQVTLRATETDRRTFSRVGVTAVLDAEGENLSKEDKLKITADLNKAAGGEEYLFSVDTLLRGASENLLAVHAALPAGARDYAGDWKLLARSAQLEPFFIGVALPDFDARGEGKFTFNPTTFGASLQGRLEAEISRLENLEPAWRAIGAVKATAQFDVAEADGVARLNLLNITLAGEKPVLAVSAARAAEINFKERRLQVGGTGAGEALNVTLHGVPLAWVRPFVQAMDISGGEVTGQLAITGESDRLRLRAVESLHVDQLTVVQAGQLLLSKADILLGFEAVLTNQELQAVISNFTLKTPAGDTLTAQAKVTLPAVANPSVTLLATYTADLPTLLAPWLPLGQIKATGETDLTVDHGALELRRLSTTVSDVTGLDLFKVTALRAFSVDLATRRTTVAGVTGAADLLRVAIGRVPLSALPLTLPGTKLDGQVAQGDFLLSADGDKLVVRAPVPFKLADVSLTRQGQPALTGLTIELQPSVELTGSAGLKLQTGELVVRAGATKVLLTGKGEASQAPDTGLQGALTFNLEVPALATQPLFAGAQAVSAGRASGEVRAVLGKVNQVEARMTVNGLVAANSVQTLPVANLSFRAVAQPDGKISLEAPLLLDRSGQRSDLNFAMYLTPVAGRAFVLDGRVSGEHVELADALAVLGVFMASAADQPAPMAAVPSRVVADVAPAWGRFSGQLALDVKSVTRGADWAMTGLTGLVTIEPTKLTMPKLEAVFGEKGRLAAKAALNFSGGAQPYDLSGDLALTEFDAGKLFKAIDPTKPATVEGVFAISGRFTGAGETLPRVLERTHGAFELTSRQGVFRGLQRTTNKVSMATKAVDLVGSLFGSSKVAEKVAGSAYVVDQLAQSIGEFNYDQLSVKLLRDESLNVTMEDISLVSPEIRLIGKGTVTYVAGKPLLDQPLRASLSLAARGKVEEQLNKLKALSSTRDELDYAKAKEVITVGGTLGKPDPTAFFVRLATARLGDLLAPDGN